ncbi:unnamed protein product, partial [Heterosigma akashiwo]
SEPVHWATWPWTTSWQRLKDHFKQAGRSPLPTSPPGRTAALKALAWCVMLARVVLRKQSETCMELNSMEGSLMSVKTEKIEL